jgi:hypothetical protein
MFWAPWFWPDQRCHTAGTKAVSLCIMCVCVLWEICMLIQWCVCVYIYTYIYLHIYISYIIYVITYVLILHT